jgi:hypothetical protein
MLSMSMMTRRGVHLQNFSHVPLLFVQLSPLVMLGIAVVLVTVSQVFKFIDKRVAQVFMYLHFAYALTRASLSSRG